MSNMVQDEEMFCWLWGMWYFACIEIAFLVAPNFPVTMLGYCFFYQNVGLGKEILNSEE